MLSPIWVALTTGLVVGYEFNVGEFLAWEMKDKAMGGEKLLLAYLCLITQLCLAAGVQELPDINKMIEPSKTLDLGLIRDTTNPLAKQVRRATDIVANMFKQSGQPDIAKTDETAKTDSQTEPAQTSDTTSTPSSSPLIQFVPPRSRGMPTHDKDGGTRPKDPRDNVV